MAGWNHGSWFKIAVSVLAKCMECAGETGQGQLHWSCAEALGYFAGTGELFNVSFFSSFTSSYQPWSSKGRFREGI